ncbi:MAG: ABC transporter substrate-binding protein [Candidatus Nanopelagicales bacterium]|jgi:ABC-type branched-subunit amino acid transport system substrate-binding protein
MIRRSPIAGAVVVLGAASLVLAACGGSSSTSESSSAAPASSSAAPSSSSAEPAPSTDCQNTQLKIGTLLPATGDLAFLGPPEFAGVDLAVSEIDAAGGVLGQPVVNEYGDSGDTKTDLASQTVDSHLSKGVQVIIGAASSGVTFTVIDKITSNGVLQISPANTAPSLTDYPDNGLYFRTAPSDVLQGAVIAGIASDLGLTSGATIAREDPYGVGLQDAFVKDFTAAGGTITSALTYDPAAPDFAAEVAEIAATNPEFVQVVGFEETTKLLQEMIKQGIGPQDVQIFLVDGNISTTAYKDFPKDTMTGVIASVPTGDPSVDVEAFNARLLEQDPNLTDFAYGAQAYDATILVALAADYAGCADGTAIAAAMPMVANADAGGEACQTYADCLAIIQAGGQPNYDGVTGPLDFNEYGDPKAATIDVVQYITNTKFESIELVGPVEVPVP